MTGPGPTLVVRSRLAPWLSGGFAVLAAGSAALALMAARATSVVPLLVVAVAGAAFAVRAARMAVRADPDGLTARGVGATRRYRWSDIEVLGTRDHVLIGARLTDGREVPLLHHRGLGDRSTDDAAEAIDRWAREHRAGTGPATTPRPTRRRLPRPLELGLGATLVAVAAAYTVWTGHWAGVAAGVATLLMARQLGPRSGDGRQFRPVPPPDTPAGGFDGRGPA